MSVDLDRFARHLGFATVPGDPAVVESLETALATARAIITPHLLLPVSTDPDTQLALDLAVLTAGQDLWRRKDAIGGQYQWSDGSEATSWLPRDVLASVWPLLTEAGLVAGVVIA